MVRRVPRNNRRLAARMALALWSLLAACSDGASDPSPRARRPDILLVSIDSLRPDHLGSYGYPRPTSPTIDRLAEEGVRFASAVSTTSWTLPAHAALFTGLYDSAHGAVDNRSTLAESHITLAEALRDAGYRTAGFFAGPYLHPVFGLSQGFDTYLSCMTALPDDLDGSEARRQSARRDSAAHGDVTGPRTLERFDAWLETSGDEPFFAFVHLWDPHYDYNPPQRYVDLFDSGYSGSVDATDYPNNRSVHADMAPKDLAHVIALYDGEIRFTDEILGRILDRVRARGRAGETLVVVTADHGQEFFEHGGKGHHRTLYDEVVRLPLIFHWPGRLPAGRTVADQVRLIDVMPTLLSLVGVAPPSHVQGRDLSPILRGGELPESPAFLELLSRGRQLRASRTNQSKVWVDDRLGIERFHDLRADPAERRPMLVDFPRARQQLNRMRATQAASARLHPAVSGAGPDTQELPEDIEERLRSLGYVEDDRKAGVRPSR